MTHQHRTRSVVRSRFEEGNLPSSTFLCWGPEQDKGAGDVVGDESVAEGQEGEDAGNGYQVVWEGRKGERRMS
jgi:hypothetical protein